MFATSAATTPAIAVRAAILSAALGAAAAPAFAHHSFSMFDRGEGRERTITGIVTEVSLVNPHGWFKIEDEDEAIWSFEMASPGKLRSFGWQRGAVRAGEEATVTYFPLRFGSYGGQFISVTFADGRTLDGMADADRGFPGR